MYYAWVLHVILFYCMHNSTLYVGLFWLVALCLHYGLTTVHVRSCIQNIICAYLVRTGVSQGSPKGSIFVSNHC